MKQWRASDADRLTAEAADWFAQLNDGSVTAAAREHFTSWLLRSEDEVVAYLSVAHIGAEVAFVTHLPTVEQLVAAAHPGETATNVIELRSARHPQRPPGPCKRSPNRARGRRMRIAAGLLLATVSAGALLHQLLVTQAGVHLRTQSGEQRSVVLEEGSTVVVNTESELSIVLSKSERRVALNRGEARFSVAKDPGRPFVVLTPQAVVRALGTEFNVHIAPDGTVVSVIEGRVQVGRREGWVDVLAAKALGGSRPAVLELRAGQQVAVTPRGRMTAGQQQPFARSLAWPSRHLSFDNETLAGLIRELNRYHRRPIAIADPELAAHQVTGTFDVLDDTSLLQYLERYQGVAVDYQADGLIVLRHKR